MIGLSPSLAIYRTIGSAQNAGALPTDKLPPEKSHSEYKERLGAQSRPKKKQRNSAPLSSIEGGWCIRRVDILGSLFSGSLPENDDKAKAGVVIWHWNSPR